MNTKTRGFCLLLFPHSSLWKSQLSAEQTVHMGSHNRPAADLSILPAAYHWSKFSCTETTNVWLKFVKVCAQSLLCLSLPVVQGYSDFCFERRQSHATTATPVIFLILRVTSIYILYAEIRCIPFHSYLLLVCWLLRNSCHRAHREGKYNPVVALHQFRFTKAYDDVWAVDSLQCVLA